MSKISVDTRKEIVGKILQEKRHCDVSRELAIGQTTIRPILQWSSHKNDGKR